MKKIENLILIGGNGRNIGKTTLTTGLITRLKDKGRVVGIKVTSIYPDDTKFHGQKDALFSGDLQIIEELNYKGNKDTSRMLQAGASRVYFIQVKDQALSQAATTIENLSKEFDYLVCESSSLRKVTEPHLFILVKNPAHPLKQTFLEVESLADTLIISETNEMIHIKEFLRTFTL